uniref:Ig-like domain-containing protein n=1 Tax=Myripristis murdjan TaxID=586833 RepID=A0A667ZBF3_9TELE
IYHVNLGNALPCWSPLVSSFKVTEGSTTTLSCQYSVKRFGLSRVCWGRSCGTFWCSNILVQTDENGVISKVADRYRLTGDVLDGQMDLAILNVRRTDSGPYCCRVDIDGIFNDKKVIMNLRVVKGRPVARWKILYRRRKKQYVESCVNYTCTHALLSLPALFVFICFCFYFSLPQVEDSVPTLSLQINVPILSLSLSLLLLLAGALLFLAFKRIFSSKEPPHIIYEIRMRRPVQENIYTLD